MVVPAVLVLSNTRAPRSALVPGSISGHCGEGYAVRARNCAGSREYLGVCPDGAREWGVAGCGEEGGVGGGFGRVGAWGFGRCGGGEEGEGFGGEGAGVDW